MKYWCPHHQNPGLFHQWRRGAPPVLKRTLRNRRDLIIRQNPQNFRALGPKWAKRNGHTKMALCAKFSRYAALNAHICRGKSLEGSDRARCYAFNSFPLPYECRFNTPLSLDMYAAVLDLVHVYRYWPAADIRWTPADIRWTVADIRWTSAEIWLSWLSYRSWC